MSIELTNRSSDRDILTALEGVKLAEHKYTRAHYGLLEQTGLLVSSALLEAPPTFKAYRGHIGIGRLREWNEGQLTYGPEQFVGFCTWGRVDGVQADIYGYGTDLEKIIKGVNRKLREKQSPRKGYQPVPGTGMPQLDRFAVIAAAREILNGGYPTAQAQQNGITA